MNICEIIEKTLQDTIILSFIFVGIEVIKKEHSCGFAPLLWSVWPKPDGV